MANSRLSSSEINIIFIPGVIKPALRTTVLNDQGSRLIRPCKRHHETLERGSRWYSPTRCGGMSMWYAGQSMLHTPDNTCTNNRGCVSLRWIHTSTVRQGRQAAGSSGRRKMKKCIIFIRVRDLRKVHRALEN